MHIGTLMAELFSMDTVDLIRLRRFYRKAGPKAFNKAAAFVLTGFALGVKRNSRDVIHERFEIRQPKFIDKTLWVTKADPRKPMGRMKAIFGTLEKPRFTGLEEQELGTASPRARVFTSAAREGNFSSMAKGYARLKPQAKYPSPNQPMSMNKTRDGRDFGLQGLSGAKRIVAFLMILNERNAAQTFILRRNFGRFKRGLYRFKQGVVKKLQSFDTRQKPKRVKWMTMGRKRYFDQTDILKVWANAINKTFKKR